MSSKTGFIEEMPPTAREYIVGAVNPGGGPPRTRCGNGPASDKMSIFL